MFTKNILSIHKIIFYLLICSIQFGSAQEEYFSKFQIHSHNDYQQSVPFWNAYANGLTSIEVDVFLEHDVLYVTHDQEDIIENRTIENLYLQPIKEVISLMYGSQEKLQLLVDIKSKAEKTLEKLVVVLKNYPEIINNENIKIVISGNRPSIEKYPNYPKFIHFDHQNLESIEDTKILDKIALISLNFRKFSVWNGKGRLTADDYKKVKSTIDKAHSFGKPFRFWATPDSKSAWKAFSDMGVDFINTDMPNKASIYLETLNDRIYYNKLRSEVYTPTFNSDKKNSPIKNVLLLIGDGNGLNQISSSVFANGGSLTLTQLKSIGFIKTQSADDFTTDSAAAGTALATGSKTNNRAIGMDTLGNPLINITELLDQYDFVSGCITTDEITGATPASFYAHRKDRSEKEGIARDLLKSKLSLFIGGGSKTFENKGIANHFSILEDISLLSKNTDDKVGYFISEESVPSVLEGRGDILSEATKNGLEFLNNKNKPFFLMVEGAQIDWNGHTKNIAGIITEGIDFDKAITEAIKFADKEGNTLVVVTADHETGGLSLPQGDLSNKMIEGDFTTFDHTGTMVPVFAYGPHSEEFQGVYENSELLWKIIKVLSINLNKK
ncbi:alkaline phosphatase [Sabulilitoribacter arenilitoris]|uniref:Alkaline phosphatase n=1 Tax=Wocania arenilitoris TaxID=2044858 RepID=A0AAE3ERL8_9FLAO|nr:alkaline phosphatase [Wocania arenilitoris]MCF7568800.1 alkaline phosphatase [Wocania arenilitoris]